MMRKAGYDPGLALHMAKIMECGAQCGIPLAANDRASASETFAMVRCSSGMCRFNIS